MKKKIDLYIILLLSYSVISGMYLVNSMINFHEKDFIFSILYLMISILFFYLGYRDVKKVIDGLKEKNDKNILSSNEKCIIRGSVFRMQEWYVGQLKKDNLRDFDIVSIKKEMEELRNVLDKINYIDTK